MSRALETVEQCDILRENAEITLAVGAYKYKIERTASGSTFTVTDGKESLSAPVRYAFGQAAAGQTYILEHEGSLYESRVSYYRAIPGLDLTMGADDYVPHNIVEAMGRKMGPKEIKDCFGCHTLGSFRENRITLNQMIPGVQCESCHGPAQAHVDGMKTGNPVKMPSLAGLSSEEVSELCGSCHRTWARIASGGPHTMSNVRFQPYRLTNSKCYDAADTRISCVACHDPHEAISRNVRGYDAKCTACHSGASGAKAKACPVKKEDCTACHMPKYDLPHSHFFFTDHHIRVYRQGDPYPN